jgi:hypothetical protein
LGWSVLVMRYPMPGVFWMACGSPSLRLSRPIVTRTVLVNGSAFSSQARSSRRSALSAPGLALRRASSRANSFGRQIERSRVTGCGAGERVELDSRCGECAVLRGGSAAGERPDSEDELGEVEGFGEVVVGAEREPGNPVGRRASGSEHQDHRGLV